MKSFYLLITLLFFSLLLNSVYAQKDFDGQIKKMSDTLTQRLLRTGKKRLAVSNFTDLQGNVTELGKYIAEVFSIELSNSNLEVVDRSRLKDLLQELKMTEEKLTTPANALKLGEMAGVEYIITGTTTPLDNTIDITVKALDIQKGISIGGQKGAVPRTDAINNLMRNTVNGVSNAANVNMAKQINTNDRAPIDDLFEAKIADMRKSNCYNKDRDAYFGQICFENQTGDDLIFAADAWGWPQALSIRQDGVSLTNGSRNCSPLITVTYPDQAAEAVEIKFTFQTQNVTPMRSGTMRLMVERCKVKSIVLNKSNLVLK
ncbi:MAG TPA: FlgO family outer membrane protein [Chitinophaga sp.]|uniref:FlgO family outer membrane protein n=1 Tax=Chitinophaga sp. TaxID=1869181 RepID=UPI002F94C630